MIETNGKMTLTFNQERYKELLCQYQPKVIKNEADNEIALNAVEQLMHTNNRTPEEDELYDLLITLIERFEEDHYQPGATYTPVSMLHFLMEQQGIEERDLIQLFGSQDAVAEILHGKAIIGVDKAEALSNLFNVDLSLFI